MKFHRIKWHDTAAAASEIRKNNQSTLFILLKSRFGWNYSMQILFPTMLFVIFSCSTFILSRKQAQTGISTTRQILTAGYHYEKSDTRIYSHSKEIVRETKSCQVKRKLWLCVVDLKFQFFFPLILFVALYVSFRLSCMKFAFFPSSSNSASFAYHFSYSCRWYPQFLWKNVMIEEIFYNRRGEDFFLSFLQTATMGKYWRKWRLMNENPCQLFWGVDTRSDILLNSKDCRKLKFSILFYL